MAKEWGITPQKYLSPNQIYELLGYLKSKAETQNPYAIRNYHLLKIMLETGLRVSEVTKLEHRDLFESSLVVRSGKGNKDRTIQLTSDAIETISSWVEYKQSLKLPITSNTPLFPNPFGFKYSKRMIQKIVSDIFKDLRFENLSCHSCRHTYCSNLISKGVPLSIVRDNMGHSNLTITNLYTHSTGNLTNITIYTVDSPIVEKHAPVKK